jgi:hypothetical protein
MGLELMPSPIDAMPTLFTDLVVRGIALSDVACRNMLPAPGLFADALRHSFTELAAAANVHRA